MRGPRRGQVNAPCRGGRRRYDGPIGPDEYDELCRRLGAIVEDATPPDAVVAVVSKGDPRLIDFEGRTGVHFPRDAAGRYAGHHPASSEEAVAHLEALRGAEAQYFCLPATASWWLDHYQGLEAWLDAHCHVVAEDEGTCVVYDLLRPPDDMATPAEPSAATAVQLRALLDALLPESALLFVVGAPVEGLATPGRTVAPLAADPVVAGRSLSAFSPDKPTFVLVARDGSPTDPAFEDFLAQRAEAIARREHLCDLFRLKPLDSGARMRSGMQGEPRESSDAQPGEAEGLAKRLERLGQTGKGSSAVSIPPISDTQT